MSDLQPGWSVKETQMGSTRLRKAAAILVAVLLVAPQYALAGRVDEGEGGHRSGGAPSGLSPTSSAKSGGETSMVKTAVSSSGKVTSGPSAAPDARHERRRRRPPPIVIIPWLGYPFFSYTSCYDRFWPYFTYSPYCAYYGEPLPYAGAVPTPLYSTPPAKTEVAPPPGSVAPTGEESNQFARRGDEAFRARDYKAAAHAWRHAVVDDPKNGTLVMMLAQALFAVGEYGDAAGARQWAMVLLPEEKWGVVVSDYSQFYANPQDYVEQLKRLERAVKENPNDPALRFELGFQYGYSGKPGEAVHELGKLLELAPQDQLGRKLRDLVTEKANDKRGTPQAPFD